MVAPASVSEEFLYQEKVNEYSRRKDVRENRHIGEYLLLPMVSEMFLPSGPDGPKVARARTGSFIDFVEYTFPRYKTDPFHRDVAKHLDEVVSGEVKNLMLFAPPQHGKSELVSTRLPPYFLARNPELPVALVSYAAKLAERNSRNARYVIQDPRYRKVFIESQPDMDNWRVYDWHMKDVPGYALAVGVGGAITGHGFGLIVIDDPIESWAHAQSEIIRESTWQWWLGTLKTRLWEGGRTIVMMTRWHKDDMAGRILEEEGRIEEGGKWKVLEYPALCDTRDPSEDALGRNFGDPLAPSRYSREYLEEMRGLQSKLVWMAEYQQRPTDPEGTFFRVQRIAIEETAPADLCRMKDGRPVDIQKGVRFWDLAATEKSADARDPDYASGTLMAESTMDRRFWVLDQIRGQWGPEQVADEVVLTAKLDGKKVKIRIEQEPGSAGKSLIKAYQRLLAGWDVEGVPVSGDKMVRSQGFATQVNAGNVVILKADWNKPYVSELAGFPQVGHDDQVDSSGGSFNEIIGEESRWISSKFLVP